MYIKSSNGNGHAPDVHVVDLRTDTISQPTQEMRQAMLNACVGDDVYGEDATVNELERKSAELVGNEDAVFVASGTMANLIAIMVHCTNRGSEIISGDKGHTFKFEQGGPSQIAGVQSCTIKNHDDGTFDLNELKDKIYSGDDIHKAKTDLIIVENTHNVCGGKVLPLEWLEKLKSIATENSLPVHMDGARVFNAASYLKIPVEKITRHADTVCFCLSKGLGAPVGSILAGSKSFCTKARRTRKVLGGGWRQAGFLAAAGIVALDTMVDRLKEDHENARKIAKAIADTNSKIFKVDPLSVHTNILMMHLDRSKVNVNDVKDRLANVLQEDVVRVSVKSMSLNEECIRFVLYWEIEDDDVRAAIDKITFVIKEYDTKLKSTLYA